MANQDKFRYDTGNVTANKTNKVSRGTYAATGTVSHKPQRAFGINVGAPTPPTYLEGFLVQNFRMQLEAVHATNRDLVQRLEALEKHRLAAVATLDSLVYRLRMPIWVEVDYGEESGISAYSPDFEEFATGATESEALANFREVVIEVYERLSNNEHRLGPLLVSKLRRLREVIETL